MEGLNWQTVLSIISTASALLIAWMGFGRTQKRDSADESAVMATMQASLATLQARLEEVLRKLDRLQEDNNGMGKQIALLDSSYRSMHKRQDEMATQLREMEERLAGHNKAVS